MDNIINIIACPLCHDKLIYDEINLELICKFDKIAFPIINNIPVLLKESVRNLS